MTKMGQGFGRIYPYSFANAVMWYTITFDQSINSERRCTGVGSKLFDGKEAILYLYGHIDPPTSALSRCAVDLR